MNVVDPILFQCRWQPLALALCAPDTIFSSVTYGRLAQMIHNVGRNAREHGLVRGNIAALTIKDPILHVAFILGLTKLGVVPVSPRELILPKELRVDAIFADAACSIGDQRATVVDKNWTMGTGLPSDDVAPVDSGDDEPCRIILTSGTTGNPKATVRTTRLVYARLQRFQTVYGSRFPECSRIFIDVGMATGPAHTFLIHTLTRGGTLFMHGGNVAETVMALSSYRVQALIGSPRNLAGLAELCEKTPAFRGGLDVVISTGGLVTRALSERVRALLSTNFVCSYGSSEAGTAASGPASEMAKIEGAVGYIAPGVTIDIVDPSGEKLPAGKVGRVRIRRDSMVDGYFGDSEEARRKFREAGFFPGDIGAITPNRILIIAGREHAVINIGGDKMNPERIEAVLTSFVRVGDAAAFATVSPLGLQQVGCAVVWKGEADMSGLREHLVKHLPPLFVPQSFIAVDAIPRNTSGKIDRTRLNELAAQRLKDRHSAEQRQPS